jgi:hypothetical protein
MRRAKVGGRSEGWRPCAIINASSTDYRPIKQMRLVRFDGRTWQPVSNLIGDVM